MLGTLRACRSSSFPFPAALPRRRALQAVRRSCDACVVDEHVDVATGGCRRGDLCFVRNIQPHAFHPGVVDGVGIACRRIDFPRARLCEPFNERASDAAICPGNQHHRFRDFQAHPHCPHRINVFWFFFLKKNALPSERPRRHHPLALKPERQAVVVKLRHELAVADRHSVQPNLAHRVPHRLPTAERLYQRSPAAFSTPPPPTHAAAPPP